jgi:hypothetical protein
MGADPDGCHRVLIAELHRIPALVGEGVRCSQLDGNPEPLAHGWDANDLLTEMSIRLVFGQSYATVMKAAGA